MVDITIRYPAVAGSFYPSDERELRETIAVYLAKAKDIQVPGKLRALVVPHAGYIYSAPIAAYGYKLLTKYKEQIDMAIIFGPSHYSMFAGACESGCQFWETPFGKVQVNSLLDNADEKTKELIKLYPEPHLPEHCIEVQLPFLQTVLKEFSVHALLCGQVDPAKLADVLVNAIDDKTVIIASSDLSHYLSYDEAVKTDNIANESVPALNIKQFEKQGDACGKTAILTLMHIAKKKKWKGKLLDYRNSGDTAGSKAQVVGYGCYAFYE